FAKVTTCDIEPAGRRRQAGRRAVEAPPVLERVLRFAGTTARRIRVQLSDIDLTDMDRFQDAFPHEWFTFLRREAPVWFHPPTDTEGNERGFWVVTKYED